MANEIKQIKLDSTNYDIIAKNGAYYIEGAGTTDATAKTSAWTGTSEYITSYYDGLTIKYKIGVAGQTTTTLNINNLGAKRVYRFSTTTITTHFPVGSIITLTYHTDLNDGCWMCNDYDANSDTKVYVYRQTSSYNGEYPLLVSRTKAADIATKGSNGSKEAVYAVMWDDTTKVPTLNPSTGKVHIGGDLEVDVNATIDGKLGVAGTVTATQFMGPLSGNASSATSATKATQDGNGNVITDTYATKTDIGDIAAALDNIILQTEAILGYSAAQQLAEEAAKQNAEGEEGGGNE